MKLNNKTLKDLKKFAQIFKDAREKNCNEADTVRFLTGFFESVLGYNNLNEISMEMKIKDRFCDFGIKINGILQYLVEAKSASHKFLGPKDIEQAENYASRQGISWVVLTNGIEWKLYHLSFNEGEGISHDEIFSINFADKIDENADQIWDKLSLLSKASIEKDELSKYLLHKKALSPASLIKCLSKETVLKYIRRELNHGSIRLDLNDVFEGLKNIISKDALIEAGDISIKKTRKRRQKKETQMLDQLLLDQNIVKDNTNINGPYSS